VASLEEARGMERVWLLFEGADEGAVAAARDEWRRLTGAGIAAQYWSDEGDRWQMKTEKRPSA
jgi:DNA polymerase III subunit chi